MPPGPWDVIVRELRHGALAAALFVAIASNLDQPRARAAQPHDVTAIAPALRACRLCVSAHDRGSRHRDHDRAATTDGALRTRTSSSR